MLGMAHKQCETRGAKPPALGTLLAEAHPAVVALAALLLAVVSAPSEATRAVPSHHLSGNPPSWNHHGHVRTHAESPQGSALGNLSPDYRAALAEQLRLRAHHHGELGSAEPTTDAFDSPERVRALRQAFADTLDPPGRVRAMSRYTEARAQCSWTSIPASGRLPHQQLGYSHKPGNVRWYPNGSVDSFVYDTCHVRADGEGSFWSISHVGPIKSVGGDQHNFVSLDVGDLSEELAAGRPIWLTGHALQLIARGGTPLGSPPVHVHHAQLRRSSHWTVSTEIQNGAAVETLRYVQNAPEKTWGGDNQCMEAEGGTDCFIAAYPFGVGTQLPPSSHGLAFDTILLDLRPDGSEAIEFYIQVGIRWTRKAQVPLRNIESFRAGRGPYNTYRISDQSASMSWGAAQAPHSGRFVHTHVHAHREFFNSMMIFAASPEQLGLAGGSGALDFSNFGPDDDVVELEKIGYSIEEAQAYLLKHLARSQRLCSLHGNCTNAPTLMCAFMDQGREPPAEGEQGPRKGAQWDRMRTDSGDCDSVFIKKGDVITQVMFHPRAENRELHWAHNLYLALFMEAGNHDAEEVAALHEFSALRHNQDRIIGPWQFATIVADGEDP
mmetsp:Transcript_38047/g.95625  ORF Transcript_38047/g.95625 Transcript_38047/m.95625 type:complete len:609 (+) Transcript_38047:184-2010(+)